MTAGTPEVAVAEPGSRVVHLQRSVFGRFTITWCRVSIPDATAVDADPTCASCIKAGRPAGAA